MDTSESIKELAAALAKAQGQMRNPPKNKVNPHFKSKYADLSAIIDAARDALAANGLSVLQGPISDEENSVGIKTLLMHSSGEWATTFCYLPVSKNDAQGIGSALTYARRYALSALLGLAADDDDDGNAAVTTAPPAGMGKMTAKAIADFKASMDAAATEADLRKARKAAWEAADFQMDTVAHEDFKEYARKLAEKKFPAAVAT